MLLQVSSILLLDLYILDCGNALPHIHCTEETGNRTLGDRKLVCTWPLKARCFLATHGYQVLSHLSLSFYTPQWLDILDAIVFALATWVCCSVT